MLLIRHEQMETLERYAAKEFEDRMVRHLKTSWTEEYEALGEAAARETVRKALKNAGNYCVESEYDVARYLNIMFALGHDFDTDDRFPWANSILASPDLEGSAKMDQLCERAEQELDALAESDLSLAGAH